MKIVEIEWVDITEVTNTSSGDSDGLVTVKNVGYYIGKFKHSSGKMCVKICHKKGTSCNGNDDVMIIPVGVIVKMRYLK